MQSSGTRNVSERVDDGFRRPQRLRGLNSAPARRSPWRQRLIDAENGIRLGVRTDSTFFVHLFVGCGILATAMVVGLSAVDWAILVLSMTFVLSAEMFNQMLRILWKEAAHHLPQELRDAVRIGTAAVVISSVGAVIAIGLVFARALLSSTGG